MGAGTYVPANAPLMVVPSFQYPVVARAMESETRPAVEQEISVARKMDATASPSPEAVMETCAKHVLRYSF